jgi:hypothetical protein
MNNHEPFEWTDEERSNANLAIGDLVDQLIGMCVSEDHIHEAIGHYKRMIGDEEISYKTWENRFVAMSYRVVSRYKSKIEEEY